MNLEHKTVLVVGTGISGISATELLNRANAKVILFDGNRDLKEEDILKKLPDGIQATIQIGEITKNIEESIELLVISPGVPIDSELVSFYRNKQVPVWGEIELAYRFSKGSVIAITGTNGKTTTTSLVGQIMKDHFEEAYVVGNIGNPYTSIAFNASEKGVVVAEISSFQLETIDEFKPKIAAILNITPDHLNRHYTMENYIGVKESISKNQTKKETCILNYEDENTRNIGLRTKATVLYFSSARKLEQGIYLEDQTIYFAILKNKPIKVMDIKDMNLLGIHNIENVMAAIGISYSYGVPLEEIIATIRTFKAVEHRIEYVATKRGVDYYNDSKGTNPDAAIKGIKAMNRPTLLIGGGYDKENEYDEWIESFEGKVKYLILLGQTKDKIAACARKHGFVNIIFANDLKEVMDICVEKAVEGDAVLLSPACASWGMFPNYEVRGNLFKEFVSKIEE